VASRAFAPRRLRIVLARSKSWLREARGIDGRASAERYTVHLRAICPEGAGRSASCGARRRLNVMATLTLALDRCYGWLCRAFVGHATDGRHQADYSAQSLRSSSDASWKGPPAAA